MRRWHQKALSAMTVNDERASAATATANNPLMESAAAAVDAAEQRAALEAQLEHVDHNLTHLTQQLQRHVKNGGSVGAGDAALEQTFFAAAAAAAAASAGHSTDFLEHDLVDSGDAPHHLEDDLLEEDHVEDVLDELDDDDEDDDEGAIVEEDGGSDHAAPAEDGAQPALSPSNIWRPQTQQSTCEFSHVIANYSKKRESGCKKAEYSPITVDSYGNRWRLIVYVNGNGRASNHHLSLFLQVADSDDLPFGWKKAVSYVLTLEHPSNNDCGSNSDNNSGGTTDPNVDTASFRSPGSNQTNSTPSNPNNNTGSSLGYSKRNPDKTFKLCPKAIDWGWSQFITSDRIQQEGYIHNDSLTVRATVTVKSSSINIDPADAELYLKYAVEEGKSEAVETCLEQGAGVNCQFKDDLYTPLHTACSSSSSNGSLEVLNLLLDRGADANACNKWRETPLLIAANNGHRAAVEALLDHGADPSMCSEAGWSALTFAAHKGYDEIVELLLESGAPVNCQVTEDLSTPLHKACAGGKAGHLSAVKQLIDGGADVHALNKWRETPLLTAANHGQGSAVEALLDAGADPCKCTDTGWSPLSIAAYKGHDEVVRLLLEEGAPTEEADPTLSALLQAATKGLPKTVELLLAHGADHTVTTKKGDTALSILVEQNLIDAAVEMVTEYKASVPRCSKDRKKVQRARLLINLRVKQQEKEGKFKSGSSDDDDDSEQDDADDSSLPPLHDENGIEVPAAPSSSKPKKKKKKKKKMTDEEKARAAEEELLRSLAEEEDAKAQQKQTDANKKAAKKKKKKERDRQLKLKEERERREREEDEARKRKEQRKLEAERDRQRKIRREKEMREMALREEALARIRREQEEKERRKREQEKKEQDRKERQRRIQEAQMLAAKREEERERAEKEKAMAKARKMPSLRTANTNMTTTGLGKSRGWETKPTAKEVDGASNAIFEKQNKINQRMVGRTGTGNEGHDHVAIDVIDFLDFDKPNRHLGRAQGNSSNYGSSSTSTHVVEEPHQQKHHHQPPSTVASNVDGWNETSSSVEHSHQQKQVRSSQGSAASPMSSNPNSNLEYIPEVPAVGIFREQKLAQLLRHCTSLQVIGEENARLIFYRWVVRASHSVSPFLDPMIPSWTDEAMLIQFFQRQLISVRRNSKCNSNVNNPNMEVLKEAGSALAKQCLIAAKEVVHFRLQCNQQIPENWADTTIGLSVSETPSVNNNNNNNNHSSMSLMVTIDWSGHPVHITPRTFESLKGRYSGEPQKFFSCVYAVVRRYDTWKALAGDLPIGYRLTTGTCYELAREVGVTFDARADATTVSRDHLFCGMFHDVDVIFGGFAPFGKEGGGGESALQYGGSTMIYLPLENAVSSLYMKTMLDMLERSDARVPLSFAVIFPSECFHDQPLQPTIGNLPTLDPRLSDPSSSFIRHVETLGTNNHVFSFGGGDGLSKICQTGSLFVLFQNQGGKLRFPVDEHGLKNIISSMTLVPNEILSSQSFQSGSDSPSLHGNDAPVSLPRSHMNASLSDSSTPMINQEQAQHLQPSNYGGGDNRSQVSMAATANYAAKNEVSSVVGGVRSRPRRGRFFELEDNGDDEVLQDTDDVVSGMFNNLDLFGNNNLDVDVQAISLLGFGHGGSKKDDFTQQ